jgi:hypothetical protein
MLVELAAYWEMNPETNLKRCAGGPRSRSRQRGTDANRRRRTRRSHRHGALVYCTPLCTRALGELRAAAAVFGGSTANGHARLYADLSASMTCCAKKFLQAELTPEDLHCGSTILVWFPSLYKIVVSQCRTHLT